MSTHHLIDPETLPILELLAVTDMTRETLAAARVALTTPAMEMPPPAMEPETRVARGRDGAPDIRLLVFNPPGDTPARAAMLHIHGGGMVLGTADMGIATCAAIAMALDMVVVSVDYRLAPETPFPGPQEDCYAGLDWLIANATALRVDPARVLVMGESAGGGLAAACALMVRDRGEHALGARF